MNRAASFALLPLSAIYGAAVRARNALYRRDVFHSHKVGAPVISVGNLTTGGTGKTPLVEWIASELHTLGRRGCVLTRGYGRATSGRVIVSDGNEILADVSRAGDEAFLLAEQLKGRSAVICDADRAAAATWALENLGTDVFILDDAFQHQQIGRNLSVVTIDATNPWGNGFVLPAGILREPRGSLARADCVVITRSDQCDPIVDLQEEVRAIRNDLPVFLSRMKQTELRVLNETNSAINLNLPSPVAAFCGIANPESFFALLRCQDYDLVHRQTFRDHYNYKQADIDQIVRDARARGAQAIITTSKDAVKVRSLVFGLSCWVAEIAIEIDRHDEFRQLILSAIK